MLARKYAGVLVGLALSGWFGGSARADVLYFSEDNNADGLCVKPCAHRCRGVAWLRLRDREIRARAMHGALPRGAQCGDENRIRNYLEC